MVVRLRSTGIAEVRIRAVRFRIKLLSGWSVSVWLGRLRSFFTKVQVFLIKLNRVVVKTELTRFVRTAVHMGSEMVFIDELRAFWTVVSMR